MYTFLVLTAVLGHEDAMSSFNNKTDANHTDVNLVTEGGERRRFRADCRTMALNNKDFPGADFKQVYDVKSWQKCQSLCAEERDCVVWSWGKPGCWYCDYTCFMKNDVAVAKRPVDKDKVVSGHTCAPRYRYNTKGNAMWSVGSKGGYGDGGCLLSDTGDFSLSPQDARKMVAPPGTAVRRSRQEGVDLDNMSGFCEKATCVKERVERHGGKTYTIYGWSRWTNTYRCD